MAVGSKSHKPTGVDHVIVSQGTRQMAKMPASKFADIDQEIQFILSELDQTRLQFAALKRSVSEQISRASKSSRDGQEFLRRKNIIESESSTKREELRKNLADLETWLRDAKLRSKQESERNAKSVSDHLGVGQVAVRNDGSIDYGLLAVIMLNELKSINGTLSEVLAYMKERTPDCDSSAGTHIEHQ